MGVDPVTIGLIASTVASAAGTAQSIGTAHSSMQAEKQNIRFADAKKSNAAAQAEKSRQENLRRALASQRAGLASSGIEATSQSALASVDNMLSQSQQSERQRAMGDITQSRTVSNASLNNSLFKAFGQTNSFISQGKGIQNAFKGNS